jgi:hypothetical protein
MELLFPKTALVALLLPAFPGEHWPVASSEQLILQEDQISCILTE